MQQPQQTGQVCARAHIPTHKPVCSICIQTDTLDAHTPTRVTFKTYVCACLTCKRTLLQGDRSQIKRRNDELRIGALVMTR